jgi:hypothetical protein
MSPNCYLCFGFVPLNRIAKPDNPQLSCGAPLRVEMDCIRRVPSLISQFQNSAFRAQKRCHPRDSRRLLLPGEDLGYISNSNFRDCELGHHATAGKWLPPPASGRGIWDIYRILNFETVSQVIRATAGDWLLPAERLGFSNAYSRNLLNNNEITLIPKQDNGFPFCVCFYLFVFGFICFAQRLAQIRHKGMGPVSHRPRSLDPVNTIPVYGQQGLAPPLKTYVIINTASPTLVMPSQFASPASIGFGACPPLNT